MRFIDPHIAEHTVAVLGRIVVHDKEQVLERTREMLPHRNRVVRGAASADADCTPCRAVDRGKTRKMPHKMVSVPIGPKRLLTRGYSSRFPAPLACRRGLVVQPIRPGQRHRPVLPLIVENDPHGDEFLQIDVGGYQLPGLQGALQLEPRFTEDSLTGAFCVRRTSLRKDELLLFPWRPMKYRPPQCVHGQNSSSTSTWEFAGASFLSTSSCRFALSVSRSVLNAPFSCGARDGAVESA